MVPNWKLTALEALAQEVKQLQEQSTAADFALEEAEAASKLARAKWNTADDLLDKLREHVEQMTPKTEGGAK